MVSPGKSARCDQVRKLDFPIERIDVVSILIDLVVPEADNNIADFQTGFGCRHVRFDACHVDAGGFAGLPGEIAQLRITRGEKTESRGGETAVMLRLRVFQEMRDNRSRYRVEDLSSRIEPQEQTGELVILDERDGVAVIAVLHRDADAIGKKLAQIGRVTRHLDRGHESFGANERAGGFELPRREAIADHRIERKLKRREAVQEFLIGGLEERQVRFIISDHDICRGLFAGLRALQLDVILIRNQIRRDKDAALRQDRAQSAF